jgi:hypothetical protein
MQYVYLRKLRTEIKYSSITINFHATVPLTKEPVRMNAALMRQLISKWLLTAGRNFFERSEYLKMMLLKAEGLEKAAASLSVHTRISVSKHALISTVNFTRLFKGTVSRDGFGF